MPHWARSDSRHNFPASKEDKCAPTWIRYTEDFSPSVSCCLSPLMAFAAVACGGGDEEAPAATTGVASSQVTPIPAEAAARMSELRGDINIDGSSTVFPITEAMAEEFGNATDGNVRITVGVSGTGGGFKKFCAGEIHVTDASRPIKQSEIDMCAEGGVEYVEIPVAIDGLSVMINPSNDFVECMTVGELHTIWRPEAEEVITKWNQVRPDGRIRTSACTRRALTPAPSTTSPRP